MRAVRGAAVLAAMLVIANAAAEAQECAADCDASDSVTVDELLRCVSISLGHGALAGCDACDRDGNTEVSIDELIHGVDAALQGCPVSPTARTLAHFDLSHAPIMDWGDVPFPSDLYRDAGGAIAIGALPTTKAETPLLGAMRDLVETRDGFCATCNIYFRLDGPIDPATLPSSATATTADAVLLADVDPTSPERGRLFPLRMEWNAERHLLAVRPVRGIALHRRRRYAALVTNALLADDGSAVAASATFQEVRRRRAAGDVELDRARDALAPALDELERLAIGRNRVVAIAAFTTEDVTADVLGTRAAVQAGPALEVSIDRWRRGPEIDDLLGVPGEDRPGIDVPPAVGVAGTRSIVHDAISDVITGTFFAPRLVTGSGIDIGTVRRDADGHIAAGPREAVPFVLTLPKVPSGPQVPVIVAHHGFNASRVTGFASANTAARAGVAVLAIDAFQHGNRAASATDTVNAIRGNLPGADGFAETMMLDVSGRVFGLLGAAAGLELFPGYAHGAFVQFAADIESATRLVREGGLAQALRDGGAAGFEGFAADRIGFIGNSLGAVVGSSVLTAEPDLRFAVQNVPPGSIVETLAESPAFRPLVDAVFLPILGLPGPFDEVTRHLLFDPIVDLSRWILEPVDPLALAPYLLGDPVRAGGAADILFQVAGLDEVAAPLATQSMLTATGTTRATRYDPAAHGMLEVLNQSSLYEAPVVPPFVLRPAELPIMNPLIAEHAEIEAFLSADVAPPTRAAQ